MLFIKNKPRTFHKNDCKSVLQYLFCIKITKAKAAGVSGAAMLFICSIRAGNKRFISRFVFIDLLTNRYPSLTLDLYMY